MTDPLSRRVSRLEIREERTRQRLRAAQNSRLSSAGLFFLTLILAAARPEWRIEAPAVIAFTLIFGALVRRTANLKRHANHLASLAAFYRRQARRRAGLAIEPRSPEALSEALAAAGPEADLTLIQDLNLIGPHSLFTALDETVSDGGRAELVRALLAPGLDKAGAEARQEQIASLAAERWFFIRLLIAAGETEMGLSTHQAREFLKKPLAPERFGRWVLGLCALWLLCLAGIAHGLVSGSPLLPPAVLASAFIAASLFAFNSLGPVHGKGVGLALHLSALVALFSRLETRDRRRYGELLSATFASRPSRQLRRFHFVLGFLSAESHPLVYLVLNGLFPWAAVFSWALERERKRIHASFPQCLNELHHLEALVSLTFLYVYQTKSFPRLHAKPRLEFTALTHPLIPRDRVVANDFAFAAGQSLGLVTGSNMSGKSTFLRAIGINQTLANMGAPCFAGNFETSVFEIASCIQVSDSLRDGFSYFYSEVLRLKRVIEDVRAGRPVLFLIDEIFRGTNNRERQIGSRAVIKNLVSPTSLGFVSTHDLELTSLEQKLPGVVNLHFREEILGGQMLFSYKLQPGPCPTTNALVIMEQAGLDVGEV